LQKPIVAKGPGPKWLRNTLAVCACIYWIGLTLEADRENVHKVFPRPVLYFMQVASLFPKAAPYSFEYHAEGWFCSENTWREIDTRPFFPLRADDKENRFDRAMFFFATKPEVNVLHALDDYLVTSQNARGGAQIGGVQLSSVRIPIPPPGQPFERYRRKKLDDYPLDWRHLWYHTPSAKRMAKCKEARGQKGS